MGLYGPLYGSGVGAVTVQPSSPALSTVTTAESIRDRMIAVIKGLTPDTVVGDRYMPYRNEGGADFKAWAAANPSGCRRRFQVRDVGEDVPPAVSNTDYETRSVTFRILVAYPQTHRDGPGNALDRDDTIDADRHRIEFAIGMCGRRNFNVTDGYPDACWYEGSTKIDRDHDGVDFIEIVQSMYYLRTVFG